MKIRKRTIILIGILAGIVLPAILVNSYLGMIRSMAFPKLQEGRAPQIIPKDYPEHEEGAFLVEVGDVPFLIPHAYFRTRFPVVEGHHPMLSLQASLPGVGEKGWEARKELPSMNWMMLLVMGPGDRKTDFRYAERVILGYMGVKTSDEALNDEKLRPDIEEKYSRVRRLFKGQNNTVREVTRIVRTPSHRDQEYAILSDNRLLGFGQCGRPSPGTYPGCDWYWQSPGDRVLISVTFRRQHEKDTFKIIQQTRARIADWNRRAIELLGYGEPVFGGTSQ